MGALTVLWFLVRGPLAKRATLAIENLALRQQLAALRRSVDRPRLRRRDRLFWTLLAGCWSGWRRALVIVSPATVVRWHRRGFRLYWRRKSRGRPGDPAVAAEVRRLIRQMARENVTRGAPRIASELRLLGHAVADATVAKYLPKPRKPPSQTWRAFLNNHVGCLAAIDICVVPTATSRVLYLFVVLLHERRQVAHVAVTEHPSATWAASNSAKPSPSRRHPAI